MRLMRIASGRTSEALAAEMDVTAETLSAWENGTLKICAADMLRLTIIFDCEIREFFYGLNLEAEI